jgi:hypothetical protein
MTTIPEIDRPLPRRRLRVTLRRALAMVATLAAVSASVSLDGVSTSNAGAAEPGRGVVVKALGREYLAYPDVKGTVQFSNCWGGARIPLVQQWIQPGRDDQCRRQSAQVGGQ